MNYDYKHSVKQSVLDFLRDYPDEYSIYDGKISIDSVIQGVQDKFYRRQTGYVAPDVQSAIKWCQENIDLLAQALLDYRDNTPPRDLLRDDPFWADCAIRDSLCNDDFVKGILCESGLSFCD